MSDRALLCLKHFSDRLFVAGVGREAIDSLGGHSNEMAGKKQAGGFLNVSGLGRV
jgi:hypothetical protein